MTKKRNWKEIISNLFGGLILGGILVYTIWEPVLPSRMIIDKMAGTIDTNSFSPGRQSVVCFVLSGKGGGTYSLQAEKGKTSVLEGETDTVDLIIYMEASQFNSLLFSLAKGTADEFTFNKLIISKHFQFAGDLNILNEIFSKKGDAI